MEIKRNLGGEKVALAMEMGIPCITEDQELQRSSAELRYPWMIS
jgi:hypothetical protein